MNTSVSYQWRRQILWGLTLVAVGLAFFLDRMGIADTSALWHYWPLLLVVIGINRTIGYPTARDFIGGIWTAFIGLWLFANFEGLFGLNWANSWPVFIIISGVTIALRPFAERRFGANKENINEKR
jgi:hypothetical protein